jgi:hypothetical protein
MYHGFNFASQFHSDTRSLHAINMHDESKYPSSSRHTALLTTQANSWTPTQHYPSTACICQHFRCRADTTNHHRFSNCSTTQPPVNDRWQAVRNMIVSGSNRSVVREATTPDYSHRDRRTIFEGGHFKSRASQDWVIARTATAGRRKNQHKQ